MPVKFTFDDHFLSMSTWLLLHQTYNSILRCEDKIFSQHGITTEQHSVLIAVAHVDNPATPTEVAQWLDRNTNSVSLIVERMVRAGLIRRIRDLRDRRSVRLVITDKGKEILYRATDYAWTMVQEILSGLPEEELRTLNSLLETVREKAIEYLKPGETLEIINRNDYKKAAHFMKLMSKYGTGSAFKENHPAQEG